MSGSNDRLVITIIKGDDIKSGKSLFGKADPYVLVSVGEKLEKTKVNSGGGTDPVWNEDLIFDVNGSETQLNITVFDKQTTGDDRFMAEYVAPMSQILKYGIEGHVDLVDKHNKPEGKLYMTAKFDKVESVDAMIRNLKNVKKSLLGKTVKL